VANEHFGIQDAACRIVALAEIDSLSCPLASIISSREQLIVPRSLTLMRLVLLLAGQSSSVHTMRWSTDGGFGTIYRIEPFATDIRKTNIDTREEERHFWLLKIVHQALFLTAHQRTSTGETHLF
jgi:hypothetical protein